MVLLQFTLFPLGLFLGFRLRQLPVSAPAIDSPQIEQLCWPKYMPNNAAMNVQLPRFIKEPTRILTVHVLSEKNRQLSGRFFLCPSSWKQGLEFLFVIPGSFVNTLTSTVGLRSWAQWLTARGNEKNRYSETNAEKIPHYVVCINA